MSAAQVQSSTGSQWLFGKDVIEIPLEDMSDASDEDMKSGDIPFKKESKSSNKKKVGNKKKRKASLGGGDEIAVPQIITVAATSTTSALVGQPSSTTTSFNSTGGRRGRTGGVRSQSVDELIGGSGDADDVRQRWVTVDIPVSPTGFDQESESPVEEVKSKSAQEEKKKKEKKVKRRSTQSDAESGAESSSHRSGIACSTKVGGGGSKLDRKAAASMLDDGGLGSEDASCAETSSVFEGSVRGGNQWGLLSSTNNVSSTSNGYETVAVGESMSGTLGKRSEGGKKDKKKRCNSRSQGRHQGYDASLTESADEMPSGGGSGLLGPLPPLQQGGERSPGSQTIDTEHAFTSTQTTKMSTTLPPIQPPSPRTRAKQMLSFD